MKNKKQVLALLNQIIEHEQARDGRHKREAVSKMDFDNGSGESFSLHHLKILKNLIKDD